MHTIWFKNSEMRFEHVTMHNIIDAQVVWDQLSNAGFYMQSTRP